MAQPLLGKKLSTKQKKFVKEYVKTGKIKVAAVNAGYKSPDYGSYLKAQPVVQNAIEAAMIKAGITDTEIGQKIREGLDATTPPLYGKDGETPIKPEHPDFHVRKEYLDICLKVKGAYAPERKEIDKRVIINVDVNTLRGMAEADVLDAEEVEEIKQLEAHPEEAEG